MDNKINPTDTEADTVPVHVPDGCEISLTEVFEDM